MAGRRPTHIQGLYRIGTGCAGSETRSTDSAAEGAGDRDPRVFLSAGARATRIPEVRRSDAAAHGEPGPPCTDAALFHPYERGRHRLRSRFAAACAAGAGVKVLVTGGAGYLGSVLIPK